MKAKQDWPTAPKCRYERATPGELLHLDTKKLARFDRPGHRVTGDVSRYSRKPGYQALHVAIDDHSRVGFSLMLADETVKSAIAFVFAALRYYRERDVEDAVAPVRTAAQPPQRRSPSSSAPMGLTVVPHGFRSTFRDWAAERTNYPRDVDEMALTHAIGDKVEAAYRRGDLFEKRGRTMADWAKFCATPSVKAGVVILMQIEAA